MVACAFVTPPPRYRPPILASNRRRHIVFVTTPAGRRLRRRDRRKENDAKIARGDRPMPVTVRPLTAAVGAEVSGVNLAALANADFAPIEQAWNRYSALL